MKTYLDIAYYSLIMAIGTFFLSWALEVDEEQFKHIYDTNKVSMIVLDKVEEPTKTGNIYFLIGTNGEVAGVNRSTYFTSEKGERVTFVCRQHNLTSVVCPSLQEGVMDPSQLTNFFWAAVLNVIFIIVALILKKRILTSIITRLYGKSYMRRNQ